MRLKVTFINVFLVLVTGVASVKDDTPHKWTPELALDVKQIGDVVVSPDGSKVAFEVSRAVMEEEKSEWLSHIYVAHADGSDSFQLTRGDKSTSSPHWSPDGKWILFSSSRGGEKSNLFRIRVDGGEAEQLTEVKGSIRDFAWAPDGSSIAFAMTPGPSEDEEKEKKEKRDARVIDEDLKMAQLYILRLKQNAENRYPVEQLTTADFNVGAGFGGGMDWSPGGKKIAFTHTVSPKVNDWPTGDISIIDIESRRIEELANTSAAESQPLFGPAGRLAFVRTDDPPTWAFTGHIYVRDLNTGEERGLAATPDEKPQLIGWSADGSALFASETIGTVDRLIRIPVDGSPVEVLGQDDVMISNPSLNRSASYIGFVSQSPTDPPEAFQAALPGLGPVQVSQVQELPDLPIGRTEVVRWESEDGQKVEGLLSYPPGYQGDRQVPLLVVVHGGPTGVFVQRFVANRGTYPIASFLAEGFAVLRVNPRGSSGYGREFRYANYGDWGGGDYRDIMAGVDHVIQMGVADPERLGVMGWSYGGFMTSWIITQTDRFDAASVGAGVTNLMSFSGTADIPGFIPDYFGGEFWEVFDAWRAHSAMFHVGNVTTPTLIQHGEEDARVPVSQGYELYTALRRQDVPVKMVVYPRQPHGVREPKLQLDAMKRNLEWFKQWVK